MDEIALVYGRGLLQQLADKSTQVGGGKVGGQRC